MGIIPAYAGSTAWPGGRFSWLGDHPRIRGEHRGGQGFDLVHVRIIPAYAGSTRSPSADRCLACGSSPHTRGARLRQAGPRRAPRIIPAYAGSTGSHLRIEGAVRDHPRIRGEHDKDPYGDEALAGSSPHTRGARFQHGERRPQVADHPRIRGEHPAPVSVWRIQAGSSPHTRGARPQAVSPGGSCGIIPAYAGSTGAS